MLATIKNMFIKKVDSSRYPVVLVKVRTFLSGDHDYQQKKKIETYREALGQRHNP